MNRGRTQRTEAQRDEAGEPAPRATDEVAPLGGGERPPSSSLAGRFGFTGGLRRRTARGVVVNAAFQIGFAALGLLQRFVAAAFLTVAEFGVWGLVLMAIIALSFLKQVGISDRYVQQDEEDQEVAFQKAFTLELAYTALFSVLVLLALPAYALIYDRPEVLLPSLVLSLALFGGALAAPLWIPLRRMEFVRQRLLEAVNPVISTVVVVALAVAGAGYWALVLGVLAGTYATALAAWIYCPYRIALRFEGSALREYAGFSWPLVVNAGAGLLAVQGTIIVANYAVGLEGVGAITLAGSLVVFAERVDGVIGRSIYPAICAVKDRTDLLLETFVKSNRLALMVGLPFGILLALFGPDLVEFVLGERWEPAAVLLQGLGLLVGVRQLGFNWNLFFQAVGETRPMAVSGLGAIASFALLLAPAILLWGLPGYVAGMAGALLVELAIRARYLARLFEGFSFARHILRAFLPVLPAVAVVLGARALQTGPRTATEFAVELGLYLAAIVAATLLIERRLLGEIRAYVVPGEAAAPPATGPRAI